MSAIYEVNKKTFPQFVSRIYKQISSGKTVAIREEVYVLSTAEDKEAYKKAKKELAKGEFYTLHEVKSLLGSTKSK